MRKIGFYITILVVAIACQTHTNIVSVEPEGLDWLPESEEFNAGAILVPENHDKPDGKKIQITYIVIKAQDTLSK